MEQKQKPLGVIRADEAYSVREFRLRCGLGDYAWRQLKANGFPVIEVGRKQFVRGSDFLDYLTAQKESRAAAPPG